VTKSGIILAGQQAVAGEAFRGGRHGDLRIEGLECPL
jgi:hypothetical protein